MKVSYKMAHEVKEAADLLWNGENKQLYLFLDKLKHKYNWSINKTLRFFDLVSKQFIPRHYSDEDGSYYPNWREFNNFPEFQIYIYNCCYQYTMPTRELMEHRI